MFLWDEPQTGFPPAREVGLKPPSNQPQVTPLLLSRLPTFLPLKETVGEYFPVPEEHPSYFGSRSPIRVPFETLSGILAGVTPCVLARVTPCVWSETRLIAPGVECPKTVA